MNESGAKIEWNKVPNVFPSSFESGFAQIRSETINHEFLSRTIGLRNTAGAKGSRPRRMNKITINSNLVRGRLDTIPTEEGGRRAAIAKLFSFPTSVPDLCPKNGTKLTNSLDVRVHASILEEERILILIEIDQSFSKNPKFQTRLILNYLRPDAIPKSSFRFAITIHLATKRQEFQLVPFQKKRKKKKNGKENKKQAEHHSSR